MPHEAAWGHEKSSNDRFDLLVLSKALKQVRLHRDSRIRRLMIAKCLNVPVLLMTVQREHLNYGRNVVQLE